MGNNPDKYSESAYTIYRYDAINNSMVSVVNVELPSDMTEMVYNLSKDTLSFFRRYQSSTETIIEYQVLDLLNEELKTILDIKVDNNSTLYYKPKLFWITSI